MRRNHPKVARRRILLVLYERYLEDPLDMLTPEDFLEEGAVDRDSLPPAIQYLADRGYVELMRSYNPPMFAAARITADGIDLVENTFEFNLRFPPAPGEIEEGYADVPLLVEKLLEEAEFAPLDGEARACLLRDVLYLRDELARPAERWRRHVIETIFEWIGKQVGDPAEHLPTLAPLKEATQHQQS